MFAIVALVIILIACLNFMSCYGPLYAPGQEIGVRKAIGAKKGSLVVQFMGESCLLVSVAFVVAMVLIMTVLPLFNELTEKSLTIASLDGDMLLLFGGVGIAVALMAGLYPAFYLSSFDAVRILRGSFRLGSGGTFLRKGLVVFQFAISILLIGGTLIVYQQMQYIHSKNLGLDRENVIYLPLEGAMRGEIQYRQRAASPPTGYCRGDSHQRKPAGCRVQYTLGGMAGKRPCQSDFYECLDGRLRLSGGNEDEAGSR